MKKKSLKAKTEGQKQFLELDGSEAEFAAKLGCGPAVIGHWRRGRRVPGEAHRHKLELLFGIPQRAWDVAPGALILEVSPETSDPDVLGDTLTITKDQIKAVLKVLENKNLTDASAAKLRDTVTKLLALRSRMERDQELLEDRFVREHPEWIKLKNMILRALRPFPEAALAVAEVIDDNTSG